MSTFLPRVGWLLLLPESLETTFRKTQILLPDVRRHRKFTAWVVLHNASEWWDNSVGEQVEGSRILFERWSTREIKLGEREYWLIPERAVLAIIEGEEEMKRDELIEELNNVIGGEIREAIGEDRELTDEDCSTVSEILQNIEVAEIADAVDEDADSDDGA